MTTTTDLLTIEDDDGFKTEWPFPEGSSLLHQTDYIAMCEIMHDEIKGSLNR